MMDECLECNQAICDACGGCGCPMNPCSCDSEETPTATEEGEADDL